MKNNKSINIYMGIIGEAYVDKETAYAVLLAAKKNILDVQAIIASANTLMRPLTQAIFQADEAINQSVQVYNKLKSVISQYNESDLKFAKLYALLSDLNENDFDDNFSNGGNIFTARENKTFAESLESEIQAILKTANELLDANKLNAVVRCKEYNIAKEMFEAMIPERTVSPEDVSDIMENELIKRINAVRNNIDYVNLVSDEIISISDEVSNKIDTIISGADTSTVVKPTNEVLYWYAGNINPFDNVNFMENLGFVLDTNLNTYFYQPEYDEQGNYIQDSLNKDFGIDGPLRANKWFHHPKHLIQDGQLIAGIDGGKAKYQYWYVAVPRHILTFEGETEYYRDSNPNKGTKAEWAEQHQDDTRLVKALYPCKPQDYEHINDPHPHPVDDNTWNDNNNVYGYEKVTTPDSYLSINGIAYEVWRTLVTVYNKQRLNVYFNFGEPKKQETVSGMYWYVGKDKPTYDANPESDEGWIRITEPATEENPLRYDETIDSKIFYVAIPKGFGIYAEWGEELTLPENEANSPYTFVYSVILGDYTYNVYITGNNESKFNDLVYTTSEQEIEPEPTGEEPEYIDNGDGPYYWYVGNEEPTNYTDPKTTKGWTSLESKPNEIDIWTEDSNWNDVQWYLAAPAEWGFETTVNGSIVGGWEKTNVTINDVEYNVWTSLVLKDTVSVTLANIGGTPEPTGEEPTGEEPEIIDNGDGPYYWYVGEDEPTDYINPKTTKGWTSLESKPNEINIWAEDPEWNEVQWYLAVPSEWEFETTVNGTLVGGWNKSNITINDIEYTVWTAATLQDTVNVTLANVEETPEPTGEEPTGEEPTGEEPTVTYYWYAGNNEPTSNTNPEEDEDWTAVDEKPNQISIFKEDPEWNEVQWYLAAPSEWEFDTTVNGMKIGGWSTSVIYIGNVEYTVWTLNTLADSINVTLTNVENI